MIQVAERDAKSQEKAAAKAAAKEAKAVERDAKKEAKAAEKLEKQAAKEVRESTPHRRLNALLCVPAPLAALTNALTP